MDQITELKRIPCVSAWFRRVPLWITPNGISYFRGMFIVPIVLSIMQGWFTLALALYLVSSILDFADGALALARGEDEEPWGAFLDPLIDKIVNSITLLALVPHFPSIISAVNQLRPDSAIPLPPIICYASCVIIILAEAGLIAVRAPTLALTSDSPIKAELLKAKWLGKLKMIVQVTALSMLLGFKSTPDLSPSILSWLGVTAVMLLVVSAILTVASLVSRLRI